MSNIRAVIKGVGGYVPEYVLTNQELETMIDTNDEWITSRTGIKERRILKGEEVGTSAMVIKAVRELIEKTNTNPEDLDFIICSTITPDFMCPVTSNLICDMIGAKKAFSFDLMAACSGFLYVLATGANFIESGRFKKGIVIGGDKMSSIVNYKDRNTCILFGDGAGCALLEAEENSPYGIIDMAMRTDGAGLPYLNIKGGGSRLPATDYIAQDKENSNHDKYFIFQEGATVFKTAVTRMADISAEIMKRNNLTGDDIQWLVPHQANKRIIDATADRMGISPEKITMNIERYGNTTNGTIPLCFWDYEKQFKKGDNIVLAAFGGGFTWGSMYLKWAYNS